jgi:acetyl-CoA acetyltransferase
VRGRGFFHEGFHQIAGCPHDITAFPAARHAAGTALADAGLALPEVDICELYAPCTITEVLASEAIGLFPRGHGAFAARDGETALQGRIPINTSGGCLARGHPPSLTGLYGVLELYEQLTRQAGGRQVARADIGLHMCELGNYNAALVHVLEAA